MVPEMNPQNPGGSVPSEPIEAGAAVAPVTPQLGWHHYAWIVAVVAIIAALLHFLGPILTPFLIGATLAYFGSPAVSWAQRHRVPRAIGTLLVVAFILLLVLALLVVLYPLVQAEFVQLSKRLPELAVALNAQVAPWFADKLGIELELDVPAVKKFIVDNLAHAQSLSLKVIAGVKAGGMLLLAILI